MVSWITMIEVGAVKICYTLGVYIEDRTKNFVGGQDVRKEKELPQMDMGKYWTLLAGRKYFLAGRDKSLDLECITFEEPISNLQLL